MTPQNLLHRCKNLIGDSRSGFRDKDDLGPFFQEFRPDGQGLEDVFEGVPHGDQILDRLRRVYEVAGQTLNDMYFIVRVPQPATKSDVLFWTTRHLENMQKLAREAEDEELFQMLGKPPNVAFMEGPAPPRPKDWPQLPDLECMLIDSIGDFIGRLEPRDALGLTLREAFYYIACDFHLLHYLLWPIYAECVMVTDPFAPYFSLWMHGIDIRYRSNTEVEVYCRRINNLLCKAISGENPGTVQTGLASQIDRPGENS